MFLQQIVDVKQQSINELRNRLVIRNIEKQITDLPETIGFESSLRKAETIALIAEVKKASPSKGVIREKFEPVEISREYQAAGAHAISVLTEERFFQGRPEYLSEIRKTVSLPLLRKDFIIDEYQIYESRLLGADAILLITGLLSTSQLRKFRDLAADLGLDSLVEVHNKTELERALEIGSSLVGINNRNLTTFDVDLATTAELAKELPKGVCLVSESGIFTYEDVQFVKKFGAKAVLVGESLMRADNLEIAVTSLIGRSAND